MPEHCGRSRENAPWGGPLPNRFRQRPVPIAIAMVRPLPALPAAGCASRSRFKFQTPSVFKRVLWRSRVFAYEGASLHAANKSGCTNKYEAPVDPARHPSSRFLASRAAGGGVGHHGIADRRSGFGRGVPRSRPRGTTGPREGAGDNRNGSPRPNGRGESECYPEGAGSHCCALMRDEAVWARSSIGRASDS